MTSLTTEPPIRRRASPSTPHIVFLVLAAAAPLASMIGNLPIAFGRANGAGTLGAFVIAGVTLLCFAVGYAAISRRIVDTGASAPATALRRDVASATGSPSNDTLRGNDIVSSA